MSNTQKNQYLPDYLVTPGEVLDDYIDSMGMTQAELADRTGLTKKTINEIIKGKAPITPETSQKLERTLGRPAHFWNNLEIQFQEDKIRLAEKDQLEKHLDWLKKFPTRAMINLEWIPNIKDKVELLEAILCFFGIASPNQWETVWNDYRVAYRQTLTFTTYAESISAWLRQGEIEAQKINCQPFSKERFQNVLDEIRGLTTEKPKVFQPRLIELCTSAGVALVFVPELPNTGVYGATRWIGDKAILQLSLRYKSNDHLWFTFFHEAGHIIKHGRKEVFIEGKGLDGEKEEEANTFASDKLIPPAALQKFLKENKTTLSDIQKFSEEINIAPGIVVGRLQREKIISYNIGNKLKIFYRWA